MNDIDQPSTSAQHFGNFGNSRSARRDFGMTSQRMGEATMPPPLGKAASMPASTMLLNLDVCPLPPFPSRAQSSHGNRLNSASSGPTEKEQRELTLVTSKTHFGRKLQVVVLIDQKVAKHLKVRELAWNELMKIADCLNVNFSVSVCDSLRSRES